ncbi:MAG: TadE/TadG family type IV pilus assembly protein [Candidatus Dormibacteria bacterium]
MSRAQAMVEFAIILPIMLIIALGATAIDSYIQAQSFLQAAVTQGSLVGARDACDPCVPNDPCSSSTNGNGYSDVIMAFRQALLGPNSPFISGGGNGTVSGGQILPGISNVTLDIECSNGPLQTQNLSQTYVTNLPSQCEPASTGIPTWDGGCFHLWNGGVIYLHAVAVIKLGWIPIWTQTTVAAYSANVIEPYRAHSCTQVFASEC